MKVGKEQSQPEIAAAVLCFFTWFWDYDQLNTRFDYDSSELLVGGTAPIEALKLLLAAQRLAQEEPRDRGAGHAERWRAKKAAEAGGTVWKNWNHDSAP